MNSENIQLAQMDIIRQVLNVSDMNILERIKTFLVNSKEGMMSMPKIIEFL